MANNRSVVAGVFIVVPLAPLTVFAQPTISIVGTVIDVTSAAIQA